jgi:hypothetical protein
MPLPQHTQVKSASALSRFLNQYQWSTRAVIRATRKAVFQQIQQHYPHKNTPLQVLIDLTTLEKCGKFLHLSNPTDEPETPDPWVRILNGKRGLHIVMLYLVIGEWRVRAELPSMAGQGLSEPSTTSVQVVGNRSNPIESRESSNGAGRHGIRHGGVSQGSAKTFLASGSRDALQS